jgi:prefoldin alpha subunit
LQELKRQLSKENLPQEDVREKVRNLAVELRLLEGAAGEVQARIGVVEAALREFSLASTTIQGLGELKVDDEILVPIGAGSYVKAKLSDTEKVLVNIGAGVTAEKTVKEALTLFENQMNELEKIRGSLHQQFAQILERMEALRNELRKFSRQM